MTCKNCGREFEGKRCPSCGQLQRSKGGKTQAIIILVLLVLPAATCGTCGFLTAGPPSGNDYRQVAIFYSTIALALALIFLMIAIYRWRS